LSSVEHTTFTEKQCLARSHYTNPNKHNYFRNGNISTSPPAYVLLFNTRFIRYSI